jgi:succinate dehydrogenase / fumarate reductase membrane anchor subunit|tara:strand:- start:7818 stop:8186 length:369 start_codon:yes stop_codon:yes gene_type:complete
MVIRAINFRRSGLFDWIVQRFSAVILAAYTIFILGNFLLYADMDFQAWKSIFDSIFTRVFSIITLIALCAHAWIGMWTVTTDYITSVQFGKNATFLRFVFQFFVFLIITVYLIWGVQIFWGS